MRYFCLVLLLSGCATGMPSVWGKTVYNVEFADVTSDQNTQYKMNIKAPAGVDLASVTGMSYDWQPDGSGKINVSQKGNVNTESQASLIGELGQQQIEFATVLLNTLAPYLGQKLQAETQQAEIEKERQFQIVDRLMENK